ncbi:MAG: tRNA (N6-threonylcarbamoyladenosine(37)-N6)-methyltransferase TrmO, partial [Candidatus Eisenbacteria bacterium]|nr:tRNA (N6-threonylcarbamoyladenosine(37)-N6)-methyltransferase TrmO [Candidatus Latescibacterota bacterium]MBD3302835.1 tRNA (N6-threonylcarbamoyladenosine(37)-N6)-methyltransferase TrmO [Candidatus Eisenbacteria bacterium]
MTEIVYRSIGIIRTPYRVLEEMPIQPRWASGVRGTVELDQGLRDGLADLNGCSHVVLLYHFHRAGTARLRVVPFHDVVERVDMLDGTPLLDIKPHVFD